MLRSYRLFYDQRSDEFIQKINLFVKKSLWRYLKEKTYRLSISVFKIF